ncbi:MAG: AMP-binding protein, partial [Sutterella wadsworthensis]
FHMAVNAGWQNFCKKNSIKTAGSQGLMFGGLVNATVGKKISEKLKSQFGGRLRVAISGGASLNPEAAKVFCGLGLPVIQGYGMTETSPIISGNNVTDNDPATVGRALKDVSIRLGEREEIQIKGDLVMKGYWDREKDTKNAFTEDGWLKTGDQGAYDGEGRLKIVGRIKEIIVTSTGEKISPVDIESALETIPLFRQTYAVGDGMPYIAVLISLDPTLWKKFAAEQGVDPKDPESIHAPAVRKKALEMVKKACRTFPAYAVPKNIALTLDEWTIDNGLLTPTLKLKRSPMQARYGHLIEEMYKGAKKSRI